MRAIVAASLAGAAVVSAQVDLPTPAVHKPITVRADAVSRWVEGDYEVHRLQGHVSIAQGDNVTRGDDAVLWVLHPRTLGQATKVLAYLEGSGGRPVVVELLEPTASGGRSSSVARAPTARQESPTLFKRFVTRPSIHWRAPEPTPRPDERPAIYDRGFAHLGRAAHALPSTAVVPAAVGAPRQLVELPIGPVRPAQFQAPLFPQPVAPPGPATPSANSFRQVRIMPRSDVGARAEFQPQPDGQSVAVINGGVNVIVEGINVEGLTDLLGTVDKIDLLTDRAVIWTTGDIGLGGQFEQQSDTPLEIYMEGNIVFRQGERTIYADRMYYDARRRTGVILNAELLTPLPQGPDGDKRRYPGLVRLKAGVIRQLDDARFVATDALVTTSRLEEPTYHLGSDTITFQDLQRRTIDPATGIVSTTSERRARSQNNYVYLGGVPFLYWPTISTSLDDPTFYINDFRIRNDSIFGTQVLADLDVYEVFGIEAIDGTEWDLSLDYLSDRGLGAGTEFVYERDRFAGLLGPAVGRLDAWVIDDNGVDNLGLGRREIAPEEGFRGRVFWNHRQRLIDGPLAGWIAQAEVGWISDRTFLEQYYEQEWDQNKSQDTGARLRRIFDNQSLSIEANAQLNPFFTQTQWLPRLDHYLIGQQLLGDQLTWFAHTHVGYANLNVATTPTNPVLAADFDLFPWETDSGGVARVNGEGERAATRQEIDYPIDLGPVRVVPFALGELAHWGSDIDGDDLQRAYVHTGVRASLPFWAVNPAIRDPLFNLNGLAHKAVFDAEVTFTDANENFDDLPLYDAIDDDPIEEIRRDLFEPVFPGDLDPRFYAIRAGVQGLVASPSTELVEDQTAVRLGMRHRLQTKRGAPGRQRIIDWLIFDANVSLFPDSGRDNFGEDVGLIDYGLAWHLGDRFTIVSDGFADVFDDGLRTASGGVRLNRPSRGNAYLGYRTIRGPFSADLITATINYRLSPKYVMSGSTVFDFSEAGNIGQSFTISRIGESLIVSVGANVDESKDNVGFNFLIEPRFLPKLTLTRRTGIEIAPAGFQYLE